MSFLLLAAAMAATAPVRDPFWPVGFEGERHVISAEPRAVAEGKAATGEVRPPAPAGTNVVVVADAGEEWARRAEAARRKLEMDRRWAAAVKQLSFGGAVKLEKGASAVLVNGRARTAGDYVRVDHDGYRFIWRVARSATEQKLRLERVKAVGLDEIKGK